MMSIIISLKRLIFGIKDAPVEHVPMRALPEKAASEPTNITVGELQNAPMPSWMAEVSKGLEFCATLQLRTPLRVLLRHGELYFKNDGLQPQIAREPWEGIWLTALKTYEEIACGPDGTADSIDFFRRLDAELAAAGRKAASDVGPILANDYLPFLIAVRRIVEANDPIEHRIEKLRATLTTAEWQKFVTQRGPTHVSKSTGADWIVECFFPRFVGTIPKVPTLAEESLSRLGLDTPKKLSAAPDETLLAIKGIGRATLQVIRDYCASLTENRDADRLDRVLR